MVSTICSVRRSSGELAAAAKAQEAVAYLDGLQPGAVRAAA